VPFGITPSAPAEASETDPLALLKANNLSDLGNAGTARSNLGLGTAATAGLTALLQAANNLSDLANAAAARTNLGIGSAATQASTAFAAPVGTDVARAWSGTGGSGSDDNPAPQDHYHPASLWTPSACGFKGWTDNPMLYTTTGTPTSGTIHVARCRLDTTGTLSSATFSVTTAGGSLTNCYIGIYDVDTLAQLAVSADQSSSWNSTGTKTVSMVSPTSSRSAGSDVYVAFLYNGASMAVRVATAAPLLNLGISYRQLSAGTGQTALPSTLGTLTAVTTSWFFAVA
jgi:hypothetical protein